MDSCVGGQGWLDGGLRVGDRGSFGLGGYELLI